MKQVLTISVIYLAGAIASGAVLYVDDNAPNDPGPGDPLVSDPAEDGSEAHPFDAIQQAIDAAANGDEVIVLPGTYTGQGNRDIDFKGKPIIVRGSDPEDPNVVAATIIDCQGTQAEPHRGFYFHTNETSTSVLRGLTIQNGYGDKQNVYSGARLVSAGGGVFVSGSAPRLEQLLVTHCIAETGGGIFLDGPNVQVYRCAVDENIGGGIASCSDAVVLECSVSRNERFGSSGSAAISFSGGHGIVSGCTVNANNSRGLYLSGDFTGEVSNCIITGNCWRTALGGGIYVGQYAAACVINCTILGNRAYAGGGIHVGWPDPPFGGPAIYLYDSIVWGNRAVYGAWGGHQISCEINDDWGGCSYAGCWYSDIEGGMTGTNGLVNLEDGTMNANPLFANPGHWDDNGTPEDWSDDTWIDGDYRLQSQAGRWSPATQTWTLDKISSPCIDAGDPASDYSQEPWWNGHRINMGAYGNTPQASKSGACLTQPPADLNNDCRVNLADLALLAAQWQTCNLDPPIACE